MQRFLVLGVALAAGGLAAATAWAQPRDGRDRPDSDLRQRLIEEFDADGDGQLNDEERAQARRTMRDRRRSDRDDAPEGRRGPRGDRRPEGRQGPRRDGPSPERGDRARQLRHAGPGPRGFIDPRELFAKFDENNDDQLSREEFLMLSIEVHKLRAQQFARFRLQRSPEFRGHHRDEGRPGREHFRRERRAEHDRRDHPPRGDRPGDKAPDQQASQPGDESA